MNHAAGWCFADMGRRIERGINTCTFAQTFAGDQASAEDLGVILGLCDSQIAYGARYLTGVSLDAVRDMVLLDPFNPRSVVFQIRAIVRHLEDLPALRVDGVPEPHRRAALKLAGTFASSEAAELNGAGLVRLEADLESLADAVASRYFPGSADAMRPEKLTGLA